MAELAVIPEVCTLVIVKGTVTVTVTPPESDDAIAGIPGNIMHIISKIKQPRSANLLFFILMVS
jgi:hypothetical protein